MSRHAIKVDVYMDTQKLRSDRRFKMTEPNTKDKILDSAEYLFATKGLKETSVRDITSHADVHLAAINYHFHTKKGLIRALVDRRTRPLNRKRLELLGRYEEKYGRGSVPIQFALHAFLFPEVKMSVESPHFMKIVGQIISHPDQETYLLYASGFQEVFSKFKEVFTSSLPSVSEQELMWRMHFLTGSMVHTCTNHEALKSLSDGKCVINEEDVVNRLIAFCAAGLTAETYSYPKDQNE